MFRDNLSSRIKQSEKKWLNTLLNYWRLFTMELQPPPSPSPRRPRPPHYPEFKITFRRNIIGITPLGEWSARRRDVCLTTHITHNRETSMRQVRFELNPSKPAAADLRLRQRGHWDWIITYIITEISDCQTNTGTRGSRRTWNVVCKGSRISTKIKVCALAQALRLCTDRTVHSGSRGIAVLYRHWGSVQAVRSIGGVEV